MTAEAAQSPVRWMRPGIVVPLIAVLVVAALLLDTTFVDANDARLGGEAEFDPETYGPETFPSVAEAIQDSAVELPELLEALEVDQEAAVEQFGQRTGSSPPTFSVRGTGVAGAVEEGLLPLAVDGVPEQVRISVQVGPVIRGTALRDAVDFITFNDFVNQMEYAGAASALNAQVREQVLSGVDAGAVEGEDVTFVGAFTRTDPETITITPVVLEVASS